MGKSSGSDSDRARKKKKRRQNSRSRSPASSSSRSPSRSRTISKHQSRHRSKRDSRSRTPERSRRSRRSRSRSRDKSFKSHSRSSGSSRSYSGKSRRSNRSRSRSRSRDRKDSREIKREKEEKTTLKKSQDTSKKLSSPPHSSQDKNTDDQLKAKLQMALKAAADADALLREQGVLTGGGNKDWGRFVEEKEKSPPKEKLPPAEPMLISEQLERAKALDDINAPGFRPQSFVSGKTNPAVLEEKQSMTSHDAAIFGTEAEEKTAVPAVEPAVVVPVDKDSAAHENLFVDIPLKEERWIKKLMYMRQRKLNGEAMF